MSAEPIDTMLGYMNSEELISRSVEPATSQVVGYYDVGDGVEHELDVRSISCAGHVAINLLLGRLVLRLELGLYVGGCLVVVLSSVVLGEADGEW